MKKFLTTILAVVLSVCACFSLTACGKKELKGFDIDLAKEVVNYLNEKENADIEVDFQEINWNQKETLLANGSIDLVWNGMTITAERQASMCISIPYLKNYQSAVVLKSDLSKYQDLNAENIKEKFANAYLGAEKGSAGESVVNSLGIGKELLDCKTQLNTLIQLKQKSIDVAIIDSIMAGYYTSTEYKDLVMLDYILAEELYGIAGRKDDKAFMSKINEALIALADTDYKDIAKEYGVQTSTIVTSTTTNPLADATDGSWTKIKNSKKIIIGYTIFQPIAFVA